MRGRFWWLAWLCLLPGCIACAPKRRTSETAAVKATTTKVLFERPRVMAPCPAKELAPLETARALYNEGKFEEALSCASLAKALEPNDPTAHSERGAALSSLGRLEEAKSSYAHALALDPYHLDALLGVAHLYAAVMPPGREHDELALLYAELGMERAQSRNLSYLLADFSLIAAMALNDLGRAGEALVHAERCLKHAPGDKRALHERAVALFELSRFDEAKKAFLELQQKQGDEASSFYFLGLIHEREGQWQKADEAFAAARRLNADDFAFEEWLTKEEFQAEIDRILSEFPSDMRRDLKGVPLTVAEIPDQEDLLAGETRLSPAILGLFRGAPVGEACFPEPHRPKDAPCRAIFLYRRNLLRAAHSREEAIEQIRVTLLHEIGHLRGEDDDELAARGLE